MDYMGLLNQAVNSAARAAGVARLPDAVRGVTDAVAHADSATAIVQKVASAMSGAAPLIGGPNAQYVRRAIGLIDMASHDVGKAASSVLAEAGQRLRLANGALNQALGGALGGIANGTLAQAARSALASAGLQRFGVSPEANQFLLELSSSTGKIFRFALGRAAFDEVHRAAKYNTPTQDRLTRSPAAQATGKGGETLTVSGAIFVAAHGSGHLDELRTMAGALAPVTLVTGYGQSLGRWYISSVDETQSYLFRDGAPRKQAFTLEFTKYGDDYQDA